LKPEIEDFKNFKCNRPGAGFDIWIIYLMKKKPCFNKALYLFYADANYKSLEPKFSLQTWNIWGNGQYVHFCCV
jgi:hypothetical protein